MFVIAGERAAEDPRTVRNAPPADDISAAWWQGGRETTRKASRVDGGFVISGLPTDAGVLVRVGHRGAWSEADTLDLTTFVPGDASEIDYIVPATVRVDVNGLAPWNAADHSLHLYAPDQLESYSQTMPSWVPYGSTSVQDAGFTVTAAVAEADALVLTQRRVIWSNVRNEGAVIGSAVLPPLTVADGTDAHVNVTMTQTPVIDADTEIRPGEFIAQGTAVGDSSVHGRFTLTVEHLPGSGGIGTYVDTTDSVGDPLLADTLALFRLILFEAGPYPLLASFHDPFDRASDLRVSYGVEFTVERSATDGSPRTVKAAVGADAPLTRMSEGPLVPRLSPPRNLRADGFPLSGPIGAAPLLQWDPPAIGVPERYVVDVIPLDPDFTVEDAKLSFVTRRNDLQLPSDVLTPGTYVLRVRAESGMGPDLAERPFQPGVTRDHAAAVSGTFTP